MKLKTRITKCNYQKDLYRIFACTPLEPVPDEIKLSKWGTFSIKGQLPYLNVDGEYDLILEVMSQSDVYGTCCSVLDVPSLDGMDTSNLTYKESFAILRQIGTTSDRLANNILEAYPDFINLILTKGRDAIDTKKINGVGPKYLIAYERNLKEKFQYWTMSKRLQQYEISLDDARVLSDRYEDVVIIEDVLKDDPYKVLIEDLGTPFEEADEVILKTRYDEFFKSEIRCSYFLREILKINESYGSTRLSAGDLYNYADEYYNYPEFFEPDENNEDLTTKTIRNSDVFHFNEETADIGIRQTYEEEVTIADLIKLKSNSHHKFDIDCSKYTNVDGFELTEEQSRLLYSFCDNDITLLIGRAGSGKTSSVKALVKLMDDNDISYSLLAPTGAAALRLNAQTNRPTSTVHRKYYRDGEINSDVILVDEMSMVGIDVFSMLISMITNPNAKIVLCGDVYQLPSISKGRVFKDIIESKLAPTIELTKVFRYSSSGAAYVGENTREGKYCLDDDTVKYDEKENTYSIGDDYKFIETSDIFTNVITEYNKLRKTYSEDEIIILCPFNVNIGDCGTYNLNETIEDFEIEPRPYEKTLSYKRDKANITFRVGSRVVNTKNNYKAITLDDYKEIMKSGGLLKPEDIASTQIFNGQAGRIIEVCDDYLVGQFNEELIVFTKDLLENLLLGRSISTHRSQGGEWKAIINIISPYHTKLLSKQLLYTAHTRMKEVHIDIGSTQTFKEMLNVDNIETRLTWLLEELDKVE